MYTPAEILTPTTFDEIGLKLGLRRFPEESLAAFRRRLLLEARQPSGPEFNNSVARKLGLFDTLLGYINPGAAIDPCCKITPNYLILWDDYSSDSKVLELDLRTDGKFVTDVIDAINDTDDFSITYLTDDDYMLSRLKIGTNLTEAKFTDLPPSYVFRLPMTGHLRQVWATNPVVFETEVSVTSITEEGEFALETSTEFDMVVTTGSIMSGQLVVEYTQWPMPLLLQPVRTWSWVDYHYEEIESNGLPTNKIETVARELLEAAPWEWGQ